MLINRNALSLAAASLLVLGGIAVPPAAEACAKGGEACTTDSDCCSNNCNYGSCSSGRSADPFAAPAGRPAVRFSDRDTSFLQRISAHPGAEHPGTEHKPGSQQLPCAGHEPNALKSQHLR